MAEITLKAETGRPSGSRASNRLRAEGKVPGTVYGLGEDPVSVAVDWRSLRAALTTDAALNALIDLEIDGEGHLTIVKELQRHPVCRDVLHVDFLRVSRNVAITVDVPIVLTGEATGVLGADGVVDQVLFALAVEAKPNDIPNELTVDIGDLQLGDTVRVGDLSLPSGVTTHVDPEDPVVATSTGMPEEPTEAELAEGEAELAEGVVGAEGAEGEGDGGGDAGAGAEGDAEG
jgi:large subunit ribosomal protein L25